MLSIGQRRKTPTRFSKAESQLKGSAHGPSRWKFAQIHGQGHQNNMQNLY